MSVLKSIKVVGEQSYRNLTVKYLRISQPDSNLVNYRQAIASGLLKVTEVNESGNVPELLFRNTGTNPVFVPEGTIIEGLKQNRFVQMTFVVNRNQAIKIPVNCIEEGRWSKSTAYGSASPFHMYSSFRGFNSKSVRNAMKTRSGLNSQGETWRRISYRINSYGATSKTGYVGDYFAKTLQQVSEYTGKFKCPETVNGFIAMIDGYPVECTLMAIPRLFRENFDGILQGVAVEAFDEDYRKGLQDRKKMTPGEFLQGVRKSKKEVFPSLGIGKDIRFETRELVGSALFDDKKGLVYLGAYAL